jgi:Ribbon-helix-helix domain
MCYGNGMKSERLVVQVEPKLKEALERYSKTSGVPISEFVRRAIVEALKKAK